MAQGVERDVDKEGKMMEEVVVRGKPQLNADGAANANDNNCPDKGKKFNGSEAHRCFNCGADDHWASECPLITDDQQAQLHMMQDLDLNDTDKKAQQHYQRMHFKDTDSYVVYPDSYTTSITFVGERNLTDVKDMDCGLAVHCNALWTIFLFDNQDKKATICNGRIHPQQEGAKIGRAPEKRRLECISEMGMRLDI